MTAFAAPYMGVGIRGFWHIRNDESTYRGYHSVEFRNFEWYFHTADFIVE
jgi:hypothetical protein